MIQIAKAPLRGAVADDGDVVADDSGSAVVSWEGLTSPPTPAEVEEDEAETPCLDDRGRDGAPQSDAKDLDNVATAIASWGGPENSSSATSAALR